MRGIGTRPEDRCEPAAGSFAQGRYGAGALFVLICLMPSFDPSASSNWEMSIASPSAWAESLPFAERLRFRHSNPGPVRTPSNPLPSLPAITGATRSPSQCPRLSAKAHARTGLSFSTTFCFGCDGIGADSRRTGTSIRQRPFSVFGVSASSKPNPAARRRSGQDAGAPGEASDDGPDVGSGPAGVVGRVGPISAGRGGGRGTSSEASAAGGMLRIIRVPQIAAMRPLRHGSDSCLIWLFIGRPCQISTQKPAEKRNSRVRKLDQLFDKLGKSNFRRQFHLGAWDKAYVNEKGLDRVLDHARDFVDRRLAMPHPSRDGKQTPFRGHPVFVAQHATATCCRSCLEKWHGISRGRALDSEERDYVVGVLERWISIEMS